jgi:hypothetical protein
MTLVSSSSIGALRRASPSACALAALALGSLFCAAPAHAEDAETRTAARDLATQGGQAFDAGHYEQASDFFLRAYELVHAPSIALMHARSLAKLGQLLEAIDVYEQTARSRLAPGAPEAYVKAVATARTEVEDVRRRVPRLKLSLLHVGAGEIPEVTIDDKPSPAALLGVDRPMNPGAHRIVVLVSGQARATRELSLEESKSYSVELDVAPSAAEVAAAPAPEKAPDTPMPVAPDVPPNTQSPERTSVPTTRILGYVGVGVGVVGLGLGTYTGLVALHHKSQLDDACHPGCPQSSADDLHGFRNNRTVSWLSYGLGTAALATGVLLLALGPRDNEHVTLRVLPGGVQMGGRF